MLMTSERAGNGNRPRLRYIVAGISVALMVGLLILLGWGLQNTNAPQPEAGMAPTFSLTSFDGETLALEELRGKVVVINFWASWCIPCRAEADELEAMSRKYRDDVVFIGVDYADTEKGALKFIEEYGLTYFQGPDLGTRISADYRIRGVPETFYVAKNGELRGVKIGPLSPGELEFKILELLDDR